MKAIKFLSEFRDACLRISEDYLKKAEFAKFKDDSADFKMYTKWAEENLQRAAEMNEAIAELESLKQVA